MLATLRGQMFKLCDEEWTVQNYQNLKSLNKNIKKIASEYFEKIHALCIMSTLHKERLFHCEFLEF